MDQELGAGHYRILSNSQWYSFLGPDHFREVRMLAFATRSINSESTQEELGMSPDIIFDAKNKI